MCLQEATAVFADLCGIQQLFCTLVCVEYSPRVKATYQQPQSTGKRRETSAVRSTSASARWYELRTSSDQRKD
jgi:hypothetical protein